MNIIEEDVITSIMITIIIIVIIITEADFMMMTTTQVQIHLQAVLRQAVPVAVIKHLPADIVQEVRLPVHQILHQAVPHLEAIRLLQVEKAAAVLRQEVQVHIIDQVEENRDIKISV